MPEPKTAAKKECSTNRLGDDAARPCHAQQPGVEQLAGFVARINALMNFPSTCGAIASTSTPCPARKALASSIS